MYFDSLHAVLAMDGHGAYVWSAYGLSVLVLVILLVNPRRRQRRLLREVQAELRRRGGQVPAAPSTESS
jgi:heme exporter protein D